RRLRDVPGDETDLVALSGLEAELAQQRLAALLRREHLLDGAGFLVPDFLRADEDNHLGDVEVVRRLPEDLLADEASTAREQDPEARPAIAAGHREQFLGGLLLEGHHPPLRLVAGDGELLVAEVVLPVFQAEEGPRHPGRLMTDE